MERMIYMEENACWTDKVMSALIINQLSASHKRLYLSPQKGIFDQTLTHREWMKLWANSFYCQEDKTQLTHTIPDKKAVQNAIFNNLSLEISLLSSGEESLMQRLLFSEGKTELISKHEVVHAEALQKRLLCHVEKKEGGMELHLEAPLMPLIMQAMNKKTYAEIREKMFAVDATLNGLLYLTGFLHASVPVEHFIKEGLVKEKGANVYLTRSLCASYDYCYDQTGDMMLLHKGLADTEKMFYMLSQKELPQPNISQDMLLGGMNEMLEEEKPACQMMVGVLHGALREAYDEEEAVDDLKMMIKQGADIEEIQGVLQNMLATYPTAHMHHALKRMMLEVVRWNFVQSAVLN